MSDSTAMNGIKAMSDLSATIPSVLARAAEQWPNDLAIKEQNKQISFSGLHSLAAAMAKSMIGSGLRSGDRFSIWAPNICEWVSTAIGGMMAGGVLVPLNTRYKGIEAGDILSRSGARILFTTQDFLDTDYPAMLAGQSLTELEHTVLLRGARKSEDQIELDAFLKLGNVVSDATLQERIGSISGASISDILYTSGTTGAPKGVLSTHGQTVAIFDAWSTTVGLRKDDRYLVVNPFFHSFGYKAGWLSCLIKGAACIPMAVFNAKETLQIIEQEKISILPGAPTIFQSLLAEPSLATTDTSGLRCSVTGAASVPEQLVHDMKNVLGFDEVFTAYGLTECPVVSITNAGDDIALVANTAGKALSGTDIKIVDNNDLLVGNGEVGAIKVKGFNVMQAYFENEIASAEAIDENGWLDTGDIGWKDKNGYVKVTDRAKDMFICGGFNCYPAEIENLLLKHNDILDVAVTGINDERLGEVACAYIVTNSDSLGHEELTSWAREHMANFKVPRTFFRIDQLPRNASGKVLKFTLAEQLDSIQLG